MFKPTATPSEKRERLRTLLQGDEVIPIPGAFNALCAKVIERRGFPVTYVSGGATAVGIFGLPDLGLYTADEMVREAGYIAAATNLPVLCDADTGFGGVLNVRRTVQAFEAAGIAGIHIEDQEFPKRCGHLAGKSVIPVDEMASKVRAAVQVRQDPNFIIIARCDALSIEGLDGLLRRCEEYVKAGADMIFPEAMGTLEEYSKVTSALGGTPVLANMTEFGKTPYFTIQEFGQAGCRAVLFPLTLLRVAMKAVEQAADELFREGTQSGFVDNMQTRKELYKLVDYDEFQKLVDGDN
jgi:methylisocitrate lyase